MVNKINIENLLRIAVDKTGFLSKGEIKYGWKNKTAGIKVTDVNNQPFWLQSPI